MDSQSPNEGIKMNFLAIPAEVVDHSILPFLQWNDLLRLRRLCKTTKGIVDAYIKVNPDLATEIEIDEDEKSFRSFLKMNIPTTKIFLNNVSPQQELYRHDENKITLFLKKFGPLIKHLRVHQVSLHLYGKEWDFFEALVNLESFEAGHYGYGKNTVNVRSASEMEEAANKMFDQSQKDPRALKYDPPVPHDMHKRLKVLKIGQEKFTHIHALLTRTGAFVELGTNLEYVALPFNSNFNECTPERTMVFNMITLKDAVQSKKGQSVFNMKNTNLKVLDFTNYHDEPNTVTFGEMESYASQSFLEMCELCNRNDVKLLNVSPGWFMQRIAHPHLMSPDLGKPVVSLVNLNSIIFPLNMPNLEKIEIRSTSRSAVSGFDWVQVQERPDWPKLKSLDITVDNKQTQAVEWRDRRPDAITVVNTKTLFRFLFEGISRTALVDLRLNFTKEAGGVAIPKAEDIVNACPNLKKLTLVKWPGTNKSLLVLFGGLKGLEDISLEYCKGLGNVAFVGLDTRNPVFFKLPKLKKLSLKGLDQMPKITDLLFTMVIRHLKLTHLILTSDDYIQSVSIAGISSLLEGCFAESIEKFSFKNWPLANVSAEEFKQLETKFRSYNML